MHLRAPTYAACSQDTKLARRTTSQLSALHRTSPQFPSDILCSCHSLLLVVFWDTLHAIVEKASSYSHHRPAAAVWVLLLLQWNANDIIAISAVNFFPPFSDARDGDVVERWYEICYPEGSRPELLDGE